MKILIAFNFYYYGSAEINCPFYFFVDTLKRMRHDVLIFDFGTINRSCDNTAVAKLLLSAIATYRPSLLFVVPSKYEIPKIVLSYITGWTNTVTVAWDPDDDRRWDDYSSQFVSTYDYMFTTYESALRSARRQGHQNVILTQWAANPKFHRPLELQKKYDASFIGVAYDDRPEYMRAIIDAGFIIKFGGKNWDKYIENVPTCFSQEDIAIITNQSKISLVFSKGCGSNLMQIKGRVFESPAYRVCTFIEDTPGLERFFIPGKEVVVFHDKRDLIEKMHYYLSHDDEREAIAEAGYQRVQRDHLYEHRLRPFFQQLPEKKKLLVFGPIIGVLLSVYFSTIVILRKFKRACLKKHL